MFADNRNWRIQNCIFPSEITLTWMTQISFGSTNIFPNSVVIRISPCWGTTETNTQQETVKRKSKQRIATGDWAIILLVMDDSEISNLFTHQSKSLHLSCWSTCTRNKNYILYIYIYICLKMCEMCENASIMKHGAHLQTNPPVNHGGIAGVDVDADAISWFGISGTTDGV